MARRRAKAQESFWAEPALKTTEEGRQAGPRAKRAKRMRRFVQVSVFTWPLLVLTIVALASNLLNGEQTNAAGAGEQVPIQVRAKALDAAHAFVDSPAQPLPNATVLGWDRAETIPWPPVETNDDVEPYETYVSHVLASTKTLTYDIAVTVAYSPTHGASVIGEPALSVLGERASNRDSWSPTSWPLAQSAAMSEQVSRAVVAWGTAYTGGDERALSTVVADPDSAHIYQPLSGLKDVEVKPEEAATRAVDRGEQPDADTVMVRVKIAASRTVDGEPFTMSFDVLVTQATSGSARVVAWGPAGSGPSLEPYQNAVLAVSSAEPTVSPSESATPTPSTEATHG